MAFADTLARPLVSLDIEATGLDVVQHEIIELGIVKLLPGGEMSKWVQRFKPSFPIPAESTAIHGITDADVADCPAFASMAQVVHLDLQGCDLLGFNLKRFDLPMLHEHFYRAGIAWDWREHRIIDAGLIFKRREERTLEAAVKYFCGRKHEGAHGAQEDAAATLDVALAQIERYQIKGGVDGLVAESVYEGEVMADLAGKFLIDKDGSSDLVFNFGKYKGRKVRNHIDYVQWMFGQAFPNDTFAVAEAELQRIRAGGLSDD